MATVDGSLADVISVTDADFGTGTSGRFVTTGGAIASLDNHEAPMYLLRARDSGVGGTVYVTWTSPDPSSQPPLTVSYTGPLVERVATRLVSRRAALPLLADDGEVISVD